MEILNYDKSDFLTIQQKFINKQKKFDVHTQIISLYTANSISFTYLILTLLIQSKLFFMQTKLQQCLVFNGSICFFSSLATFVKYCSTQLKHQWWRRWCYLQCVVSAVCIQLNTHHCNLLPGSLYVGMCVCFSMCLCVSACPSLIVE